MLLFYKWQYVKLTKLSAIINQMLNFKFQVYEEKLECGLSVCK